MTARRIGDCWSCVRGLLEKYSTKSIKGILGKASMPVFKFEYQGTHNGPVLDEADSFVQTLNDGDRDKLIIACIEEIVAFENAKNKNCSKTDEKSETTNLPELEQVLSRVGFGISVSGAGSALGVWHKS